jgi:hypothetical protein
MLSTVVTPLRCASCSTEQHRRQPLLAWAAFSGAFMASAVVGAIASVEAPGFWWLGMAPMAGVLVAYERWLYRRGEMVPTPPRMKRLAQVLFYGWIGLVVTAGALAVYLSRQ